MSKFFLSMKCKLFSRTGSLRPTSGPTLSKRSRNNTNNGVERHKSKLPRGMYINHDDIVKLASQDHSRGDDLLINMDREISTLLSQVRSIIYSIHLWNKKCLKMKHRNGLICLLVFVADAFSF